MDIIVCLKQTFDTETVIWLNEKGEINDKDVKLIINPYDEFALEEALRVKEKLGGEVTVVSLGGVRTQEALRAALALGADKAMLINCENLTELDEMMAAKILARAINALPFDMIFTGRMAIDSGGAQMAMRLAEEFDLPAVSGITKIELEGRTAVVQHETDEGLETVEVLLPAVFSAQKGLNEPRYPVMAGILKAKKKPLDIIAAEELAAGLPLQSGMKVRGYVAPESRLPGRVLNGSAAEMTAELVRLLREEAKVV
ncbi:MAG: electron transfer flavoprotein subunit beta/FixA family protein [Gracilibacteraceae bacterium]|jgi:electron transfer flavoprotein beta subunit|nr:electron transfer flavoprotein subunit beta/FixA family protein [Gracilibacteraceae bacterium]